MKKLFTPFDWDNTVSRVTPRMEKFLQRNLSAGIPNLHALAERYAENVASYIAELVRTRGQESRLAYHLVEAINGEISVLDTAGFFHACGWYEDEFRPMVAGIIEDELRRCGIGAAVSCFFDDDEEEEKSNPWMPNWREMQEEFEKQNG